MTAFSAAVAEQARRRPSALAVVDRDRRVTWAELDALVDGAAAALAGLGVGAGEVVSSQLPNWLEAVVVAHAADRLGAVHNPLPPGLGARELRFVLTQAASPVLVVPGELRGVDHLALAESVRRDVPTLRHVLPPSRLCRAATTSTAAHRGKVGREGAAFLLYTSGTTAEPKGVIHTGETMLTECRVMAAFYGLGPDDVAVIPSPVSHVSGLIYGILLPALTGTTTVLMDAWDPTRFLELVKRERGSFSAGATPFLQGVVDHPDLDHFDHSSLRCFPCGGAGVPPDLIRRAVARLGVRTGRGYGSTEFPSITSSAGPGDAEDRRATTDGRPIGANRVEIRDPADPERRLRAGEEGEIWAHGPERFAGYLDAALDAGALDADGWLRTGDLGALERDGYLTVTGRVKEVILRGGETFSAKEVEDLLAGHGAVADVAVVPVPDAALGERACAVVVAADPARPPTLDDLTAHLAAAELSRRKWPERLLVVDDLPRTASGKVRKHLLADQAAAMLGAEGVR